MRPNGLEENLRCALNAIPKGMVATYGELARKLKTNPRHVGYLLSKNDPAKAPCYKVIMANGRVGGYSGTGGVKEKIRLLRRNGITVGNGKIDLKKYGYKF